MTITRFAPSPTGKLHVGNLRPALLNWLFARKNGGQFVLRIDDTDAERSKEAYVDGIKRDLEWLGLDWDRFERQSLRLDRYNAAADDLRAKERLYGAYETATELGLKRKTLRQSGRPPVYDRAALDLSDGERAALEAEGRQPHWRFKLDQERTGWTDGIRGETNVDCGSVSDPVLIREDGGFLYTLCSVCDDIDFAITDVIRGEDHVTNTATQIQIFDALGDRPTGFAHHSLLVDADGSGLSKRLGSLTLESLREAGVEPLALLSYMARLGSSEPIEPRHTHAELIDGFDLGSFGRAPARFNREEIDSLGEKLLHTMSIEAVTARRPGVTEDLWMVIRENISSLDDIPVWEEILQNGPPSVDMPDEDRAYIARAFAAMPPSPWDDSTWKTWTSALKEETGRKGKALFMPLRLALTGQMRGPDMGQLLPFFSDEAVRKAASMPT